MQCHTTQVFTYSRAVFLKRRALVSIIPGRERPEETTIRYKISLVQLITNLNVILYLSTCHAVYISVLILYNVSQTVVRGPHVVLGFCLCGPFLLNISPKKDRKNKINVNCVSHTIVENLKQSLEITYNKRL